MVNDLDICNLAAATYQPGFKWDQIWQGAADDYVYCCLKRIEGFDVISCRGSDSGLDWMRDMESEILISDPIIGPVPFGFSRGTHETADQIYDALRQRPIIGGHSLGASHAFEIGGYLTARGRPPAAIISFGSPRPGCAKLAEILLPVSIRSYKNRFDPVTTVPIPLPGLPYMHPRSLIEIDVPPETLDSDPTPWIDFNNPDFMERLTLEDHHIELYQRGIAGLPKIPVIV